MKRIVIFGLIAGCLWTVEQLWLTTRQPEISTALALSQVNGGVDAARRVREFEALKDIATQVTCALTVLAAVLCFDSVVRRNFGLVLRSVRYANHQRLLGLLTAAWLLCLTTGCIKEYDRPEYVEIDTSETGFLIPLEGDGGSQGNFQSDDYLNERKVGRKRVQITHRWSQEGRLPNSGRWIPTVRLIKVNRSPVMREWATTQTSTA